VSGVSLRALGIFAFVLSLGACATVHHYDYASEPDPRKQPFILGPSDVLRVNVWHNPDLSGDVTVRPDGNISLPLVGEVPAAGRTPEQVRGDVSQKLQIYLKDDANNVTVSVGTINSYRYVVSGNVEHPGVFTSNHYVTVSEAVTQAGGPNRFADASETVIIRLDPSGGKKRIPVDYPGILKGKHPEEDLPLVAGDTVYVP
jgi:polysaccharide export outer membrane protein